MFLTKYAKRVILFWFCFYTVKEIQATHMHCYMIYLHPYYQFYSIFMRLFFRLFSFIKYLCFGSISCYLTLFWVIMMYLCYYHDTNFSIMLVIYMIWSDNIFINDDDIVLALPWTRLQLPWSDLMTCLSMIMILTRMIWSNDMFYQW